MKLSDLISVLNADDTIHVVTQDNSLYFGTARGAFMLSDNLQNARVSYVSMAFGWLLVEISGEDQTMEYMKYGKEARTFCEAIKTLASKPENLDNLESYLSYSFDKWLTTWANTPGNIAAEMKEFAEMII